VSCGSLTKFWFKKSPSFQKSIETIIILFTFYSVLYTVNKNIGLPTGIYVCRYTVHIHEKIWSFILRLLKWQRKIYHPKTRQRLQWLYIRESRPISSPLDILGVHFFFTRKMSTGIRTVINTFFRSYKCQKLSYCIRNKNDGIQIANVTCVCKVKTKYIVCVHRFDSVT